MDTLGWPGYKEQEPDAYPFDKSEGQAAVEPLRALTYQMPLGVWWPWVWASGVTACAFDTLLKHTPRKVTGRREMLMLMCYCHEGW